MHEKIYSDLKRSVVRIHRMIHPKYKIRLEKEIAIVTKNAAQLYEFAIRDIKTGVYNARFFKTIFRIEIEQAKRSRNGLCLMVIDADDFKKINDRLGHLKGDEILRKIADTVTKQTRKSDVVARFGGEEFVVLCKAKQGKAMKLAERVRKAVMKRGVTVSIGIAGFDNDTAYSLFKKADRALYHAKKEGKNRCVVFSKAGK